jgi:DNA-binding PadR family transcriptional regulator
MAGIEGDALRGHLESLVLAALEQGPAHGLEVIRRLEASGCGELRLKEGTLYPALYRLEAAGQVQAEWEESAAGRRGPRRKIYRLTPRGKKQLATGREDFRKFVQIVGSILGATP